MKKKIGIVLLLTLGFVLFILIRFLFLSNRDTWGELRVVASPTSSVFINNVAIGKVPYRDKYKAGEYLLKLIPEDSASQTASWQKKIDVRKGTLTYVTAELGSSDLSTAADVLDVSKMDKLLSDKGEINIGTEPSGAIIYLDNDEKGIAPSLLTDVLKGDHEISIFMPGFFRRTKKINIVPGYRVNTFVKLAVDPAQSEAYKAAGNQNVASGSASSASSTGATGKQKIIVFGTPEGTLNVRADASVDATKSATVKEGDIFDVLDSKSNWYKIEYEKGKQGWISGEYTRKQE